MNLKPRTAAAALGLAIAASALAPAAAARADTPTDGAYYCVFETREDHPFVSVQNISAGSEIAKLAVPGAFVVEGTSITVFASQTTEPTRTACERLARTTLPGSVDPTPEGLPIPYITAMTCVMDSGTGRNVQTMPLPWQAKPGTADPKFVGGGLGDENAVWLYWTKDLRDSARPSSPQCEARFVELYGSVTPQPTATKTPPQPKATPTASRTTAPQPKATPTAVRTTSAQPTVTPAPTPRGVPAKTGEDATFPLLPGVLLAGAGALAATFVSRHRG